MIALLAAGAAVLMSFPGYNMTPIDFSIVGSSAAHAAPAATGGSITPGPAPSAVGGAPPPAAPPPGIIVAKGFGHDVPLTFAVRQIVPRWRHVSYGASVDRQAHVSWEGGKPWRQVLRIAVQPLGLHVATTDTDVRIFK